MTKKTRRHGFTIVELVIVIAVIAILAAVLIPTYANLVKKANEATALADAKNLVTEMLANILSGDKDSADLLVFSKKGKDVYVHGYSVEAGNIIAYSKNPTELGDKTFGDTVGALLTTMTNDGAIAKVDPEPADKDWRTADNTKKIVEELGFKADEMIVRADYKINLDKFTEVAEAHKHTVDGWDTNGGNASKTCKTCNEEVISYDSATKTYTLKADVMLNGGIIFKKAKYTLNLNGHTLDIDSSNITASTATVRVMNLGTLTIKDSSDSRTGAIYGADKDTNDTAMCVVQAGLQGKLVIESGNFYARKSNSCIYVSTSSKSTTTTAAKVTINGGYFETASASGGIYYVLNHADGTSANCTITVNGGEFKNYIPGTTAVDNGKVTTGKISLGKGCNVSEPDENGVYTVTK